MSRIVRFVAAVVRSLIALACTAVLTVGVPVAMWSKVGRPLPDGFPPLAKLPDHLQRGSLRTPLVALLAVMIWVCWLRVAVAMVVHLAWRARGLRAPQLALLGSSQRLAATLVAGIVTIVSVPSRAPAVVGAPGVPRASQVVAPAASDRMTAGWVHAVVGRAEHRLATSLSGVAPPPSAARPPSAPPSSSAVPRSGDAPREHDPPTRTASVVVRPGDTLSGLARAHLGSAARWPDIWEANRGRSFGRRVFTDPDLIFPGWVLVLPEAGAEEGSSGTPGAVDAEPSSPTPPPGRDGASTAADVVISLPAAMPAADPGNDDSRPLIVPDVPLLGEVVLPSPATEEGDEPAGRASSSPQPVGAAPAGAPAAGATPEEATVPTADAPDASGAADGAAIPVALAAASLVAGSVVVHRRRRRSAASDAPRFAGRQPQAAAPVMRLVPGVATVPVEQRLERLGRAWRAVSGHLADPATWPALWLLGGDGTITARFAQTSAAQLPVTPVGRRTGHDAEQVAPPGWRSSGADTWVLPATLATREIEAPIRALAFGAPSLLQVGRSDDGDVYLDVQRCGGIALAVDVEWARRIALALARSLISSPFAEETALVVVTDAARTTHWGDLGFRPWVVPEAGCPAVGAALIEAIATEVHGDAAVGADVAVLHRAPVSETPWGATIVFVDSAGPHVPALTRRLRVAGAAVVATSVGTDLPVTTMLHRVPSGWLLEPYAVPLLPLGLEHEDVTAVHALLDAVGPDPARDAGPVARDTGRACSASSSDATHATGTSGDHRSPRGDGCVRVRLLGPVCVEDAAGRPVVFERAKSQELLCWLVLHRDAATRSAARAALWDTAVRDSTFANVLSDVRRSLAAAQPHARCNWLRRIPPDGLHLHELVVADVETLDAALAAHAAGAPDALARLHEALSLVRGAPFAGGWFSWADAEGITTRLTMAVVDAVAALGERLLALGRPEEVFQVTATGLSVLPGCDPLVALRLRAHAATGDYAGLRAEWDAYERQLQADPWALGPPADLVQLRDDLTASALVLPA